MNFEQELLRLVTTLNSRRLNYNAFEDVIKDWETLEKMTKIFQSRVGYSVYADDGTIDLTHLSNSLKKLGATIPAEHTLMANPKKKVFYCSCCGNGGDVVSFVALDEGLSQVDAAKLLAESYLTNEEFAEYVKKSGFVESANYLKDKISIATILHEYCDASIDTSSTEMIKCRCDLCAK
jgi:hypothetical protein